MSLEFKIDLNKQFERLPKAPIVEAMLGIQSRAEVGWEASSMLERIKALLPDYPKTVPTSQFVQTIKLEPSKAPETTTEDLGLNGFRIQSEDKPQIAQFYREGFAFSRLHPYETWEQFIAEGLRLWKIYLDLAKPTQVQNVSLRYINRIALPIQEHVEDYMTPAPTPPQGMEVPIYGFFHQDILAVPGHDYSINIVRTVQPTQDPTSQSLGLILDITIATMHPFALEVDVLNKRLPEMRWLKNEAFYGSLTERAINSFKC